MRFNSTDTPIATPLQNTPELLAPAGDSAALKAAIGNGADAVYLGAGAFNARRNATNFTPAELAEALEYAHARSASVYLTMNTLVADNEGDAALELAAQAYAAGIDAIIVQDIGLAAVLKRQLPDLPLHASTQMAIHDVAGLQAARKAGITRVILPRELSIEEIRQMTRQAADLGMQTEVFVHGALCIGFSGQCLLSSLIGGRSGNRGECAQPCRLPWQRSGPSAAVSISGGKRYPWLSPRDQALLDFLPELTQAGVASLKIEGRMRGSAYVGQVTGVYRDALDQLRQEPNQTDIKSEQIQQPDPARRRLLLAFNRGGGFTDRYVSGTRRLDFLSGEHSGSHGIELGHVQSADSRTGILTLMTLPGASADTGPERGDVIAIRRSGLEDEVASAPIGTVERRGRLLLIKAFHPDALAKLKEGDTAYQMNDRRSEQSALQANRKRTRLGLSISTIESKVRLSATVMPGQGKNSGIVMSADLSAETVNPLMPERVSQQLAKTGATSFAAASIEVTAPVSLSISSLNELRRTLLDDLASAIQRNRVRDLPASFSSDWTRAVQQIWPDCLPTGSGHKTSGVVAYFWRLPEDLQQVACGADRYVLPLNSLTPEIAAAAAAAIRRAEPASSVTAWLPAAAAGESASLVRELTSQLYQWGFDGLYSGNPGTSHLADVSLDRYADLSANIFNCASLAWFAGQCQAVCPSPEIDMNRLEIMAKESARHGLTLELPVYGRMRLMTSAYCPIGQNLPGCRKCVSKAANSTAFSAEYPDAADIYHLQDRKQQSYPVMPHPRSCTSDIFSPFILAAAQEVSKMTAITGLDLSIRLSFLDETSEERHRLVNLVKRLLHNPDGTTGRTEAEAFQQAASECAISRDTSLSTGHYRRGV